MPLENILKRDRAIVLAGLITISGISWAYISYLAWDMKHMDMAMCSMHSWRLVDLLLLFVMWAVMMVAMMVPSVSPHILLFAAVNRNRREKSDPVVPSAVFLSGYLLVWTAYSALATVAQWRLHEAALLTPMMASNSRALGGILLVAVGVFQWTPLKQTCLKHCRSPLHFLASEWREGPRGALHMGIKHGAYCVGCCWILMALLFVAGIMNLIWVALITLFVLVEKMLPRGDLVGRLAGIILVVVGILQF